MSTTINPSDVGGEYVGDEETKCLLTPTSMNSLMFSSPDVYTKTDNSCPHQTTSTTADSSNQSGEEFDERNPGEAVSETNDDTHQQYFFGSPLIYSEPALSNLHDVHGYRNQNAAVACSYSEAALPNVSVFFCASIFNQNFGLVLLHGRKW